MGSLNSKSKHFILAMDDSGSMSCSDGKPINRWQQLLQSVKQLIQGAGEKDIISVIFHGTNSRTILQYEPIKQAYPKIEAAPVSWSGNSFFKAIEDIYKLIQNVPSNHMYNPTVIVFLSDGGDIDYGMKR